MAIFYIEQLLILRGILSNRLHLSNIMMDVDGSPSGYVAWYNHYTGTSRIRIIRPAVKNDKFGVQRVEMLAIYFALVDNRPHFRRVSKRLGKKPQQQLIINIKSDSKSTVEQLQGISKVRDTILHRIFQAITKLLAGVTHYSSILFNHLERTRNIAGTYALHGEISTH